MTCIWCKGLRKLTQTHFLPPFTKMSNSPFTTPHTSTGQKDVRQKSWHGIPNMWEMDRCTFGYNVCSNTLNKLKILKVSCKIPLWKSEHCYLTDKNVPWSKIHVPPFLQLHFKKWYPQHVQVAGGKLLKDMGVIWIKKFYGISIIF